MSTRTITFNDSFSSASAPTGVDGISNWVTAQAYLVSDVVIQGSKIYECLIAHTAGVFATDLAAVKWGEISQGAVDHTALTNIGTNTHAQIDTHLANTSNPHSVTKTQVGLSNVDNTSDATKNAASVTLTNKTITGADFRTPIRLDMKQDTLANLTTYASTAADGQLCFATDTKATYVVKNSSLSSVGGAGAGINYILAPDADSGTTGWATYVDAAATSPVDGTGGAPSSTFAVSASSPLRGTSSFLWTKSAANRQGEGFSYDFTIDASDKAKVLQCSFEYQVASGTFADNDMSVWIFDVTNAVLIQPAPYLIKNSGIIEKFAVEFQTASNSTSYRLIVHTGSTSASAYTVKFDNFILGPQAKLYGSATTDWVSYTPTGTWVTNTTYTGKYRRVGDSLQVNARVTLSGAPTGSFSLNLPSGLVIDLTKTPGGAANQSEGLGIADFNVAGVRYVGAIGINNTTSIMINSHGAGGIVNATIPGTFASGSVIEMTFLVPISGWSSSQVFSQDADTRVVAAQVYAATISSTTTGTPLIFPTIGTDTHAGYNSTTGLYTAPVSGYYQVNVEVAAGTFASGNNIYASVNGNTTPGANRPIIAWSLVANGSMSGSGIVFANAGQTISIRATATLTSNDPCNLSIVRVSGPAQIAASESVSALYTGAPATGTFNSSFNTVTYGTKVKDSHNAYSGGVYTIPTSGVYDISAQLLTLTTLTANQLVQLGVSINGAAPTYKTHYNATASASSAIVPFNVQSIPLLAGSTVAIQALTEGATNSFSSTAGQSFFSITRTGQY